MTIKKIKIEHIRGIKTKEFTMDLYPNKPSIFVAPNGFGKTSIATAFNSLTSTALVVDEENAYQNDTTKIPSITITDDKGNEYIANNNSNTISPKFSIAVINSRVKPKASNRRIGGFTATTPLLTVEPIVLYNTIPETKELSYRFTAIKSRLGSSIGKLLINLSECTSNNSFVSDFITLKQDFEKLCQMRNNTVLAGFINDLNAHNGTKTEIANLSMNLNNIWEIPAINTIKEKLSYLFEGLTDIEIIVNIIQLKELYSLNKTNFPAIKKYNSFLKDKHEINEMMSFFNCTWKNIEAKKKDGKFIIDFPKANQISNGERDILCFIGKLFEVKSKLSKENSILIVDEIFDYLDDANLISAQYFLTKFIESFSKANRNLFPIILTHLDPMFFGTYSFSTKNVVYLDSVQQITNKYKINNLIKDRPNCRKNNISIHDIVASNYLHYSVENNTGAVQYLASIGVEKAIQTPEGFRTKAAEELDNYINRRNYDLALVCCGLRLSVEEKAYSQLSENDKNTFVGIFKTTQKLAFAKEKGANVPEVHFLLSIIYNEAMHLDAQCKQLNPIGYKLKNKVIHNMICSI